MRFTHALSVALVLAVAATAASLGRVAGPPAAAPAPAVAAAAAAPVPPADPFGVAAVRKLRDAQVRVNVPGNVHGAGFCRRSADGTVWVWTCAHVAVHAKVATPCPWGLFPPTVSFVPVTVVHRAFTADDLSAGKGEYAAEVVKLDADLDLALLRLAGPAPMLGSLDWADAPPPLWTPVLCCGSPRGMDCTVTRGVVSYRDRLTGHGRMDQIDAPTLGGNSGGPVCGPDGRVIGLLSGGAGECFGVVVTARRARQFAAAHDLLFAFEGTAPARPVAGPVEVPAPPSP